MQISHDPLVLGALDGRPLEEEAVLLDGELLPVGGGHAEQGFGGLQEGFRGGLGMQVGAGSEATVATVEHVAHLLACPGGQLATILYRQVGEALVRIEN